VLTDDATEEGHRAIKKGEQHSSLCGRRSRTACPIRITPSGSSALLV